MTNQEILEKLREDMELRNFSVYTKGNYESIAKIVMKHFSKPLEEVTTGELRNYLIGVTKEEGKSIRTANYHNSVIRFVFEVTLDKEINKKQIPMGRTGRKLPDILTRDELKLFFSKCTDIKYKTMFMLVYGSGLRISEVCNLKIKDINSKEMRVFVKDGKGRKDRYTILSQVELNALREYYRKYQPESRDGYIFVTSSGKPELESNVRAYFREYKRNAKIEKEVSVHTLRHCFATHLIEDGTSILDVKELMGHTAIRTTMGYIHLTKYDENVKSPLDILYGGK